jgi:MFS family permease
MGKEFWVICSTHLSIELYFLTHVALLPVFIEEFHLSLPEAALLATAPTILSLAANLPSGFAADRLNVKPILLFCLLLEALGGFIAGQSTNVYLLVLGITLIRVASPFYHNSALASVSQLFARERINRAMGYHNAFGSIGTSVGSLAVSAILLTLSWRWAYLIWVPLLLAWALVVSRTSFTPKELDPSDNAHTELETRTELEVPRRRRLRLRAGFLTFSFSAFLVAMSLWQAGLSVVSTFATTYFVQERGLSKPVASLIFGF